jgi:hypothetical protein
MGFSRDGEHATANQGRGGGFSGFSFVRGANIYIDG